MYKIEYHKKALKDIQKIKQYGLNTKVKQIVEILRNNPYKTLPPYEKLVGDLSGLYSRRINIQYRIIYDILEEVHTIRILSLWTHYENI